MLLLAYQAVRLTAAARGGVRRPLGVAATVLLAPALWISILDYGHIEQPVEMCLLLLAISWSLGNRHALTGVALGAAVLTRTIAGFCAIPLVLAPLATRRIRPTAITVVATVVTVCIGLAPFILADGSTVLRALVTNRSGLPIGGGSIWILARHASWAGFVREFDVYIGAAVATALVVITLRRKPALATDPRRADGSAHGCVVLRSALRQERLPVLPRPSRMFSPHSGGSPAPAVRSTGVR